MAHAAKRQSQRQVHYYPGDIPGRFVEQNGFGIS